LCDFSRWLERFAAKAKGAACGRALCRGESHAHEGCEFMNRPHFPHLLISILPKILKTDDLPKDFFFIILLSLQRFTQVVGLDLSEGNNIAG
jgi:hypothetical protein